MKKPQFDSASESSSSGSESGSSSGEESEDGDATEDGESENGRDEFMGNGAGGEMVRRFLYRFYLYKFSLKFSL